MPYLDPSASPKAPLVTPHSVPVITRTAPSSSTPTESKQNLSNKSTTPSGTPSASPSLRSHYFFSPSDDHSAVPLTSAMPGLPRRARSHGSASSSPVRVLSPPKPPGSILPRRAVTDKTVGTDEVESRDSGLGLSFDGSPNTPASESAPTTPTYLRPTSASPGPIQPRRKNSSPAGLPSTNILNRRTGSATSLLRVDIPSPPSGGSRGPSVQGVMSAPLPPPLIRKKSGELVKPSLKRRSTSTPGSAAVSDSGENDSNEHDAYWLCARSEPATPCEDGLPSVEKKTLRFAGGEDGEGGELEKVVLFKRDHKVTAVTRALEGEDVNGLGGTDTETEVEGFRFSFHGAFSTWNPRSNTGFLPGSGGPSGGQVSYPNGELSARDRIDLKKEVSAMIPRTKGLNLDPGRGKIVLPAEGEEVMVESVHLIDEAQPVERLVLKGNVIVRNITFGKWVTVRFTMDDWQTVSEVTASHAVHIPASSLGPNHSSGWDRFTFTINLADVRPKIHEKTLLLAVKYSIDGGREWWDSNGGSNYKFGFVTTSPLIRSIVGSTAAQTVPNPVIPKRPRARPLMEQGTFLPLLEPPRGNPQPIPAVTASTLFTGPVGEKPLTAPVPINTHISVIDKQRPILGSGWSFPGTSSTTTAVTASSPPSKKNDEPLPLFEVSTPTPTTNCPPRLEKEAITPKAEVSGPSASIVLPSGSGKRTVRPSHSRQKTWDQTDTLATQAPPQTKVKSNELSSYFMNHAGSFPPTKSRSRPSSLSSKQVSSSSYTGPISDLPSPPMSSPSPSFSPTLPETPTSALLESSPGVMSAELPIERQTDGETDVGVVLGEPVRVTGGAAPGERGRLAVEVGKMAEASSAGYAAFIDKYCFYRGDQFSSPSSLSTSSSMSPVYDPSTGKSASSYASTTPSAVSSSSAFKRIVGPSGFFSPALSGTHSHSGSSGQTTPQLLHSGPSSPMGYSPGKQAGWSSNGTSTGTAAGRPAGFLEESGIFWGEERKVSL